MSGIVMGSFSSKDTLATTLRANSVRKACKLRCSGCTLFSKGPSCRVDSMTADQYFFKRFGVGSRLVRSRGIEGTVRVKVSGSNFYDIVVRKQNIPTIKTFPDDFSCKGSTMGTPSCSPRRTGGLLRRSK